MLSYDLHAASLVRYHRERLERETRPRRGLVRWLARTRG